MGQHWRDKMVSGVKRNPLKRLTPTGSRVPLIVLGGAVAVLVLLTGWVLVSMGNPPTQTTETMTLPVQL